MNIRKSLLTVFTTIALLSFQACSEDEGASPSLDIVGEEFLTEAIYITTVSERDIAAIAGQFNAIISPTELSAVQAYRVTYPTRNYDGELLTASGLALVPEDRENLPMLSYQHGTIIQQQEAPSYFDQSNTLVNYLMVFASSGYIVAAPDYIGYGESRDVPHPFEHRATMGSSSFDMLQATKELASLIDQSTSDQLFLAGYSQGGYATMALHQYAEAAGASVTMSAPGAGAYNKSGTVAALQDQEIEIDNPGAWLWNIHVINTTSGVNRPWSDILTPSNATIIEGSENPMLWPTRSDLDRDPRQLFTEPFISGLSDGSDQQLLAAFAENDVHDWAASNPVTLYYGTSDISVFPFHAESAFKALQAEGAPVSVVAYEGLDHQGAVLPYWRDIFQQFEALK